MRGVLKMKYALIIDKDDNHKSLCIFHNVNQRRYFKEHLCSFEQMEIISAKEAYKMLNAGKIPLDYTVGYNKEDF